MTDERRIDRMAGCASLGKAMLSVGAVALVVLCLLNLNRCFYTTDRGDIYLQVRGTVKDLKNALDQYEADFNRFPLPTSSTPNLDLLLRSRGSILPVLLGEDAGGLNPKKIKFLDLPMARNRKNGLWQDGAGWVLSDLWGEPYYIVLDTNGDLEIANPEFGASTSDPKQAEFDLKHPQPARVPLTVAIYSSGPDRDPKTWKDNVCSWRSH
jgi:hypothetical protein